MKFPIIRMTTAALMTALTAVSAYLVIPIGPVPITMQSGVVLAAGALLGSRWGAMSQGVYIALGLVGIPVFAGGRSGPGILLSPTFGYLLGFIAAAFVTGWHLERRDNPTIIHIIAGMLAGQAALYVIGLAYLYFNLNFVLGQPTTPAEVLAFGLIPFLPFDAVKLALAAALVHVMRKRQALSMFTV